MDPVTAIANAVSNIFGGVVNIVEGRRWAKYGRLPDWLSPREFQRQNYSSELIIGGLALALILVLVLISKAK